jgi:two-component system sensor histidine kinase SenX3
VNKPLTHLPTSANPYHRLVTTTLLVGLTLELIVGGLVGFTYAVRRRSLMAAEQVSGPPPQRPLSTVVLEALATGVVVVDRTERAMLINPAAHRMGVVVRDRLALAELAGLVRVAIDRAKMVDAMIDLPTGRLGREPVAVAAVAVPLPDSSQEDRVAAVALLLEDVTEVRRLEAVRRDFVANVSHELKTPVSALTLLAEATEDAADDTAAVQRFAAQMQKETSRLGRLVRELIELSRLQGAEPLPGNDEVPVAHILDDAQDSTRLAAEQAGVSVVVRCAEGLMVRGNEAQLTTAVTNLVDNAINYSPAGTRVAVDARRTRKHIDISVTDQGIGIAEADLPRVFERFYRVDPARSRATGGTGLGLAIVKHVATNHGGEVLAWSAEGAGSTFTIRLPAVHPDAGPFERDQPSVQVGA